MTNFRKLSTAIATGAVLLSSVAPAFADVTVSGNGAFSENGVSTTSTTTTAVTQNNDANISNNISSSSSTGGNTANFNTGSGGTTINTGDATNDVTVDNAVNVNQATVSSCGCGQNQDITIKDNSAFTTNGVDASNTNTTALTQTNDANIRNNVDAYASTGHNDAGFNTGGDVTIRTGDADSTVSVSNLANANIARVGSTGTGVVGGSSITISGNGAFSDNGVSFDRSSVVALTQDNDARIRNNVDADAKTGGNDAGFNTGGDVRIVTGDASTDVAVDNMVNFNAADVNSCGCALAGGTDLKIAGNGAYSFNGIDASDDHILAATEMNDAHLFNDVDGDAKTGWNSSEFGTVGTAGDPTIRTGDSSNTTDVSNSGNVNMFNQGASLTLPGDLDLSLHFDLLGLWSGLLHMVS